MLLLLYSCILDVGEKKSKLKKDLFYYLKMGGYMHLCWQFCGRELLQLTVILS